LLAAIKTTAVARNFIWGGQTSEMVHFGAKVTNAVHHHWFSGVTVKRMT